MREIRIDDEVVIYRPAKVIGIGRDFKGDMMVRVSWGQFMDAEVPLAYVEKANVAVGAEVNRMIHKKMGS